MYQPPNEKPARGRMVPVDSAQADYAVWSNYLANSGHGKSSTEPFYDILDETPYERLDAPSSTAYEHRQGEDGQPSTGPTLSPTSGELSLSTLVHLPARDNVFEISTYQPGPSSAIAAGAPRSQGSHTQSPAQTLYRNSDFDIQRALWLVTSRKNPETTLGPVDMSCSFVACDVTLDDCPVIFVSDHFQNLTGYSKHELIGQNCRLLQAPGERVEAGSSRQFVDNAAVFKLKQGILEGREVQQSLINYRKGGRPFLNLLTMIPIPWETGDIKYIIGFQIDLVQSPNAISSTESGALVVDYRRGDAGWIPAVSQLGDFSDRRHFTSDNVSTILQQVIYEGTISRFYTSLWHEVLLGNLDGVVHILSLKGIFFYLSSSCNSILEYDNAELLGQPISSICHPSDIVSISRELKNATGEDPVNLVFRIRKKTSGYAWFESHGSLFQESNGRKYIFLLGRERPAFSISRRNIEHHGGIGDGDLWAKLSTSGAFLYVSANVRSLLRRHPDSLVATSIQALMHKDSRASFDRALDKARHQNISLVRHELLCQARYIQAETILYPGDAANGQRPSFLLAQIKLAKSPATAPVQAASSTRSGASEPPRPVSERGSIGRAVGEPQDTGDGGDGGDELFDELGTTKCSSWQFELRWLERKNQGLAEELAGLLSRKKRRRRRTGVGNIARDCANCHTQDTPEWRRGPSGERDLCNRCGLHWAKQVCLPAGHFLIEEKEDRGLIFLTDGTYFIPQAQEQCWWPGRVFGGVVRITSCHIQERIGKHVG